MIKIDPVALYTTLAGNTSSSGFIAYPIILRDGTKVAGLYRGFGCKGTFVLRAPKAREKGFRNLGPVSHTFDGCVFARD
jgi:hypothetical protein